MKIFQQWWGTCVREGRSGHVCEEYWEGEGGSKVLGCVFWGGGAGGTCFCGGGVGDYPLNGPDPGGVSTHYSLMYHWEAAPEVIGRELGVSSSGDVYAGGLI